MFFPKESASIEIDWPVKASCFTSLLLPQDILSSSSGEVIRPETIDYKNGDPIHRGLFCENIFGRKETYRCSCSWFGIPLMQETPINKKNIHQFKKHSGSTCQVCGAPITPLKDRLARFGHIKLAAPVTHIWLLKSQPNKIGAVLDLTLEQLEKIIYFEQYAVIESGVESIPAGTLLTEEKYRLQRDAFPDQFKVEIGAEAIRELLARQDMITLSLKLRDDLARTRSKTKMQKLQERLFVIESLRDSGNPPEWMVLEIIPVLPPDLRPLIPSEGDKFATSDLNDLYRRVINRNNRLKRLLELNAPDIIIRNEKRMLQEAVDVLFDNGSRGRFITGFNMRRLTSISDSLLIPVNLANRFRDYSYLKNSFQAFLYASHKVNQPELIDVFLAFCRGLCLSFDFSIAEEEVKSIKLTIDSKTQYLLGQVFHSDVSVSEDLEEALKWYTKASEQGNAEAQFRLGLLYDEEKNHKKAFKLYADAAEQGHAEAQNNLGVMYASGRGVKRDDTEAVKWFNKAAEQGNATAQHNLGARYDVGRGIPQDKKKAIVWYTKASEQGNAEAQFRLGLLYVEKKNYKKAFELYTEAAEQEHAAAQNNLGVMYESGRGVKRDATEAVKWYTEAAEQGNAKAQNNLGAMYEFGRGVKRDDTEAVKWFTKAAEQGNAKAQNNLGAMYEFGRGVKRDDTRAIKWYIKAAEQGDATAQNNLVSTNLNSCSAEQKLLRAIFGESSERDFKWLTNASEQGYAAAQYELGRIYENNTVKSQENKKQAIEWYTKAAAQGHAEAQKKLDMISENENISN